jgi:cobalamin biosynthesis Mg chelatase CobN
MSLSDDELTQPMLNYSAEMYKYRNIMNPTTKWENLTAHQRSVVSSYRDEIKTLLAEARIDEMEALKMNTWSTDKCWDELNDRLDKLKALKDQQKGGK